MKVKCIDNHNRYDYTIGKLYVVKDKLTGTDVLFDRIEFYYTIYDNFGEIHTFNQLGFETSFVSLAIERKNKLENIKKL